MVTKVRIQIDHALCVGNAMCEVVAPGVFGRDDHRQARLKDSEGGTVSQILAAAEACPMSAIEVFDAETGEKLFPDF